MVRYPIDGTDPDNQPVKIMPKVERQIWFGSECDTNEDKIGIWFWTKILNTAVKVKYEMEEFFFSNRFSVYILALKMVISIMR